MSATSKGVEPIAMARQLRQCAIGAVTVILFSCSEVTGIGRDITLVNPMAMGIDARVNGDVLSVDVTLEEPLAQASDKVRVPVVVQSTSGDRETILARPFVCADPEWGSFLCGRFVIGVPPGQIDRLAVRLQELDAFIVSTLGGGTSVVAYFPYGTVNEILSTVSRWPPVRFVEPSVVFSGASTEEGAPSNVVHGLMIIRDAQVAVENQVVEVEGGGELQVHYTADGEPPISQHVTLR